MMCISKNRNVTNTFFFLIHLQKAKKRKRAEKERQQGVKRLKLQPVVKPKAVKLCNFYLMGRCQQVDLSISLGDLCKFSHDATPLTKSQSFALVAATD
ncbi:hypothetical protein BHE74_00023859 [Ensete ventricosum]|nr:hypothetical protein GW17_00017011 [Ensete ventricosum]RWW68608.1 hypothetical protein BHE74_00023859 [Ensete ventricosum]RZR89666.1 hypothetical protein BHM03_00017423 [Ensete ventricosum]